VTAWSAASGSAFNESASCANVTVDDDGTLLTGFSVGNFAVNEVDIGRFNPATGAFSQDVANFGLSSFNVSQFALPSASGLAVVWGENDERSVLRACRVSACPTSSTLTTNLTGTVPQAFARIGPVRWAALTQDNAGAIARFVIDTTTLDLGSYVQLETRSFNETANRWRSALIAVDGALVSARTMGADRFDAPLSVTLESTCDPAMVVD